MIGEGPELLIPDLLDEVLWLEGPVKTVSRRPTPTPRWAGADHGLGLDDLCSLNLDDHPRAGENQPGGR
jgi:hypothetical protein